MRRLFGVDFILTPTQAAAAEQHHHVCVCGSKATGASNAGPRAGRELAPSWLTLTMGVLYTSAPATRKHIRLEVDVTALFQGGSCRLGVAALRLVGFPPSSGDTGCDTRIFWGHPAPSWRLPGLAVTINT